MRNWAGNLTYSSTDLRRPESLEELADALAIAGPVRALGSRHSFNDVADTGGVTGTVDMSLVDIVNDRCLLAEPPLTGNAVYVFGGADAVLDDVADADEPSDGVDGPLTSDVVDLNVDTGEYEYHLAFLLPGPYTLAFTCSAMADGATDDDYPAPSESGFDFDATINVEIASNEMKTCDILPPGDTPPETC